MLGTGTQISVHAIKDWKLIRRVKLAKTKDVIFDLKYMESTKVVIAYMKSEEDMSREARVIFLKIDGLN